jgi:hypothetical protein
MGCAISGGHKFPKDVDLHMKWRVAIKRSDEKKGLWKPGPNDVVCHQHFITSDYKDTLLGNFQEKKVEIFLKKNQIFIFKILLVSPEYQMVVPLSLLSDRRGA